MPDTPQIIDPNGLVPGYTTPAEESEKKQRVGSLSKENAEKVLSKPLIVSRNPWALVVRIVGMITFADASLAVVIMSSLYTFNYADSYSMIVLIATFICVKLAVLVAVTLKMAIDWVPDNYQITERQLIKHKGIASKVDKVYELANIRHVSVNESFMGRQLEYGDISLLIATAGLNEKIVLSDIKDPHHFEDIFKDYLG